jgi:hypothetical protein
MFNSAKAVIFYFYKHVKIIKFSWRFFFAVCIINCCATKGNAQTPCYIKYHYDAAGNRIKREFICAPYDDPTNVPDGSIGGTQRKGQTNFLTNDNSTFNFEAVPNPAINFLNIVVAEQVKPAILSTIITDVTGAIIFKYNSHVAKIAVASLAGGVYYVTLRTTDNVATKKIVILAH